MKDRPLRQSNIELVRIVAMMMIVAVHYMQHGLSQCGVQQDYLYYVVSKFVGSFGQVGVALFFLITGYFMVDCKIKLINIFRIVLNTVFYSWGILILCLNFIPQYLPVKFHSFSFFEFVYESVLPVSTGAYWFVTTYLVIYVLSPILNTIIKKLTKEQLKFYILLFGVLWVLIPTFTYKINYAGNITCNCIYVYMIGAFIKCYNPKIFELPKTILIVVSVTLCSIFLWLSVLFLLGGATHVSFVPLPAHGSIFVIFPAICIFCLFKNLKIGYNKVINFFASSAFSVYLITENICIRKALWVNVFQCCKSLSVPYLLCNIMVAIVASYCVCTFIDKLKDKLFMNKLLAVIEKSNLYARLSDKLRTVLYP